MKVANAAIENAVPGYTAELVTRAAKALASLDRTVHTWATRAYTRRALKNLSDRLLDDIGIDYADARQEASKPFWQE